MQFFKSPGGVWMHRPKFANDFGTSIDPTNGDITFGLPNPALYPGRRVIRVNSGGGNNANDGLSHATAVADIDTGSAKLFTGYQPGDRMLIAGENDRTYNDFSAPRTFTEIPTGGLSKAYPMLVQSYPPSDPDNQAKWGKLRGRDRPVINVNPAGGLPFTCIYGWSPNHYFFLQALRYSGSFDGATIPFSGQHNGCGWQNITFDGVAISGGGSNELPANDWLMSQCTFVGQWGTGFIGSGCFFVSLANFRQQGVAYVHCGWPTNGSRDNATYGQNILAFHHGYYTGAHPQGSHFADGVLCMDTSADGHNWRSSVEAACIASIDDPITGHMGGYSNDYTEMPLGSLVKAYDWAGAGGGNLYTGIARMGISTNNTRQGSGIFNSVFTTIHSATGPAARAPS
jgi:hypothetical protein